MSDIKGFCSSVKHNKSDSLEAIIFKHFGNVDYTSLLKMLNNFGSANPEYRNILAKVIKKIKPPVFCVYILKSQNSVVYVGKSNDVVSRLNTHAKNKEFDTVEVVQLLDENSQSLCESYLILKYMPIYNKVVELKALNCEYDFSNNILPFTVWLSNQDWFTRLSIELQQKIGFKIQANGFVMYSSGNYGVYLRSEEHSSIIPVNFTEIERKTKSIRSQLQAAASKFNRPDIFKDVTNSTFKFGKYYITELGRWRVEGQRVWYSNVDLNKLINEVCQQISVETFVVKGISPIWFGKYKGMLYADLLEVDPSYCEWICKKFTKTQLKELGAE